MKKIKQIDSNSLLKEESLEFPIDEYQTAKELEAQTRELDEMMENYIEHEMEGEEDAFRDSEYMYHTMGETFYLSNGNEGW